MGCLLCSYSADVDVGDEVAVGIGVKLVGLVGHVGGEAFCGGQTGAFSNEQEGDFGPEQIADLVQNSYSTITDCEGLPDSPGFCFGSLMEKR